MNSNDSTILVMCYGYYDHGWTVIFPKLLLYAGTCKFFLATFLSWYLCRRINHYMSVLLKSRFLSCFKKYFGQKMYAGLFIKCKRKVFSECYMYILSSRDHELIWVKLSMILFDLTRFPLHIHPRRQGGHSVQQYQERLLPAVWRRDGHSAPLSPQGR